ncbi:uncharacterized protein LOC123530206 isoform X3 [Mercenaria mercenaria]|uniref:uncharacterized protein LOC123530206 isoform X3 n=1 Tax=Mercenaria mercenaria TaxID=6596 RepID=UPI00234EDC7F|nr:uncharacterized protein LOC123530206 isoform X3 [Mercenaria mercenaria]
MWSCSVPVPYMKLKHGGSSGAYSTTVHGRLRRAPCEVSLFYDVACHGLCPPYKEDWEKNRLYMNCTDGLSYHCAKDNTTGEYVEACAEPVRCERGKEPRIVFPAGHEKTAIVVCRYCDNENFYNPYELKLSSTYYKCPNWKSRCDRNVGQINCDYERGVERYYTNYRCRCDVRIGYIQELAVCPTESPCQEASDLKCVPHQCGSTSDDISQELLKDYCCAPVCDEGYHRNETSDVCDPISSALSTATTRPYNRTTATKLETETNGIQTHIETTVTVTTEAPSVPKENTSTTATPNTDINGSLLLLVIILSVVLGAVITGVLVYGIYRTRHHNKRKSNKTQARKPGDDNGYNANHQGHVSRRGAPINDGETKPFIDNDIYQHDETVAQVRVSPSQEREKLKKFHEAGDENDAHGENNHGHFSQAAQGNDQNGDNPKKKKHNVNCPAKAIASQNVGIHEQDEDHNSESVPENSRTIPANHNGHHHNPTSNGHLSLGDDTCLTEVEINRHDATNCDELALGGLTQKLPVVNDGGGLSSNKQCPDRSNNQENGIDGYGCHICGIQSADIICIDCDKKLCRNCDITWHKHPSRQKACRRFDETKTQDSRQLASNQNQENKNHNSGEVFDNPTHDQDHRSQNVETNSPAQRVNVTAHTEGEESIQNGYRPGKTVSLLRKDKFLQPRTHTQERKTGNRHYPREPEIKIILPEKDQHNIDEMNVHFKFKTGDHPTQTSTGNTALEIVDDWSEGNIPKIVPNDVEQIDIEAEHDEEKGARLEESVQFDKSFHDVSSSV